MTQVPKTSEEVNLRSPNDMSHVFSGAYTPLICKLVEQILTRRGTQGLEDTVKLIPGGVFSTTCKGRVSERGQDAVWCCTQNADANTAVQYLLTGITVGYSTCE